MKTTEYYAVFTGKRALTVIPVKATDTATAFKHTENYKRFGLVPSHLLMPNGNRVLYQGKNL